MKTLVDLKQEEKELREKLSIVCSQIKDIKAKEFVEKSEFKIGSRVMMYGKPFEIVLVSHKWGRPRFFGRRVLKSGGLGKQEFALYGPLTAVS